ncbi:MULTISPECIES: nuclear transport factor 2 family protein [Burkholderiaceae]|uniref:nuclear transport factor 2 family protein n=1 Tax=Burkholderiaceae TaxID=119060 RepID=UPI00164177B0|nr:nuclear transport factor 2 family protein [Burkholderia gladioli]
MSPGAVPRHAALERHGERVRRLAAVDLVGLADLLDEDLVYVHSTGVVQGKVEVIDFFRYTLQILDIRTRIANFSESVDMASVGLFQRMHAHLKTNPLNEICTHSYVSETWYRCDGIWRLRHFQSTAVREEAAQL